MSTPQELDLLLNDIEMNCDPTIGSEQCNQFSIDCLSLIRHKLPPIAEEGLTIVTEYLEGRVPLRSVTDMLVKCWQYLKENYNQASPDDPVVSAIRAVIFPLTAQKDPQQRDIVDHLSLFLTLVNNVEPHYDDEESLMRKHFAKCLEGTTIKFEK
jgi:hypothetical protein